MSATSVMNIHADPFLPFLNAPRFDEEDLKGKIPKSASVGDLTRVRKTKTASKKSPGRTYKWCDSNSGTTLTAGGILFYDGEGIWVIGEKDKNGVVFSDIGGRYNYEDGNIWVTIARELREETYGLCEMFSSEIIELSKNYPPVYVNGHENTPTYICLVVPISALGIDQRKHFTLDPLVYAEKRQKTLEENPDVPPDYYPLMLTKLKYTELQEESYARLRYRLKRVLRFSPVFSFLSIPLTSKSAPSSPRDSEEDE